ncbi:hypothetical protein BDU57DRAFT_545234 [Ampelomyces quisqualis]|uniref:F-box domain-containing protein n=1 Tax=Ampelomyces quisqualis TaxID=50730 RepID=A0A6A5R362_AMPQU|nr:hypothetical protein BDU57DRAFT_545234 [Ampelomyces quisqualis]
MSLVASAVLASARVDNDGESITQQNQVNSPLLRLPSEIRNQIYEYVFHGVQVKVRKPGIHPRRIQRYQPACSLLFACRQTRNEARPSFHAAATFKFGYKVYSKGALQLYGVDEFFHLDLDTRKGVQKISIPKIGMERIYSIMIYHCRIPYLELFQCLRGVFPALKHVHTTWNIDPNSTDDTTLLRDVARDFFEKYDIELHARPPPDDDNGYFSGLEYDEIFD